jgi:branched-chain amino acid transport system permease protein
MSVARTQNGLRAAAGVKALGRSGGLALRAVVIAAFLLVALFVLPLAGGDWVSTFTSVAIFSVVAAGLGVLYGRAGMISLGQVAVLELGVWIAAKFAYSTSIPFPILVIVTGLITGVIGVLLGLPALRLSGLHLALITLMFAGAVNVVLAVTNFPNGGSGFLGHIAAGNLAGIENVRRPSVAQADTAYYRYVVVACALLFALAVLHVASKPGRAWASIRESEPAALAAGVNITFYKLWAFGLAAFMTGAAGALLAAHQGQPTVYGFSTQDSLTALATALIGGIFSFWGAIVAGVFYSLLPFLFKDQWGLNNNFLYIIFGAGLLQVLLTAPGGLAQQFPRDMANLGRRIWRLFVRVTGIGRKESAA